MAHAGLRRTAITATLTVLASVTGVVGTTATAGAMPARDPAPAQREAITLPRPTTVTPASIASRPGYRMAGADGNVYAFGASYAGSEAGIPLHALVVGTASTPNSGYWLVARDGGVASFGDAHFYGSMGNKPLWAPIVGMAATPDGKGYWLVASDGGIFSFGDAKFHGSTGGKHLWAPIVGMASTASGNGYWLVASDGGIFSFGDAHFHGSTGGIHLWKPIVGMASTASGNGYWLAASDGGIFSFGDAHFRGSAGGLPLRAPVTAMAATPTGNGYWLVGADGGIFTYGDAPYNGSAFGHLDGWPVVGVDVQRVGVPYQPGATGYDISWPQCGGALPPPPHPVSIVGLNDGRMFTNNPCLSSEMAWAGGALSIYVNTSGLPSDNTSGVHGVHTCAVSDLSCRSYNWGRSAATFDITAAQQANSHASTWWLDVETTNSWNASTGANAEVIQGLIDGLRAEGFIVGIYSTSYQFGVIAGSNYAPRVPLWIPTGTMNEGDAPGFCSNSHTFGGGITWLTQWWSTTYDHDYACPKP